MTRFLLKLTLIMTLVLTITSIATRSIGSTQLPNPALRGFREGCEDKPQPCWYGIVPGETALNRGKEILASLGYDLDESPKYISYNMETYQGHQLPCSQIRIYSKTKETPQQNLALVDSLVMEECSSLFWGDLVTEFGLPNEFFLHGWSFFNQRFLVELKYVQSQGVTNECLSMMPTGIAQSITISHESGLAGGSKPNTFDWHGFLPYRQYVKNYDFYSCEVMDHLP